MVSYPTKSNDNNNNTVIKNHRHQQEATMGKIMLPVTSSTASASDDNKEYNDDGVVINATGSNSYYFAIDNLPQDLLYKVTSFLDASTLDSMRSINCKYRNLMCCNEAGWLELCTNLWNKRYHVSYIAKQWVTDNTIINNKICSLCPARDAYIATYIDSKRNEIMVDELCFDKSGTIWNFRFKESAGISWTTYDPWYNGEDARKMVFLKDGTVLQYIIIEQRDSNNNDNKYILRTPFIDNMNPNGMNVTWRIVTMPLIETKTPLRPYGAYIRLQVSGRDVPTYIVRRNPNNWGFILENCWGIFTSYTMLSQQRRCQQQQSNNNDNNITSFTNTAAVFNNNDEITTTTASPILRRSNRKRRTTNTSTVENATSMYIDDNIQNTSMGRKRRRTEDVTSTSDNHDNERNSSSNLNNDDDDDDSTLVQQITSNIQWREALLYNLGASILPGDGHDVIENFTNAWHIANWLILEQQQQQQLNNNND